MRAARAPAKLNLSLLVDTVRPDGFHPIQSIVTTIDWYDDVRLAIADDDQLAVTGLDAPTDESNLVSAAVRHLRSIGASQPLRIELTKRIPIAAGLGGGSSDAAATIIAASAELGLRTPDASSLVAIGADVPYFVRGGLARMSGIGEVIEPLTAVDGYAVVVAVPPIHASTPAVYRRWDELGEPVGPELPRTDVPPQLRSLGPFRNDLWPAAVDLHPDLADWRAELRRTWGTAVALTGSGSGLFAFFSDLEEAHEARRALTVEPQHMHAGVPVPHGARLDARYTHPRS